MLAEGGAKKMLIRLGWGQLNAYWMWVEPLCGWSLGVGGAN